jgi:hypothetical protein
MPCWPGLRIRYERARAGAGSAYLDGRLVRHCKGKRGIADDALGMGAEPDRAGEKLDLPGELEASSYYLGGSVENAGCTI